LTPFTAAVTPEHVESKQEQLPEMPTFKFVAKCEAASYEQDDESMHWLTLDPSGQLLKHISFKGCAEFEDAVSTSLYEKRTLVLGVSGCGFPISLVTQ